MAPTSFRDAGALICGPAGGRPRDRGHLASLRRGTAAVVVWGASSDHRQVMATDRSYERMRGEALTTLTGVGIETRGVLADIATAPRGGDSGKRRPVVVALATAPAVAAALAPLIAAGIRVRTVMTPAAALASLARTRHGLAMPNAIEAYVALEETTACIALVRDGALLTARELTWGYVNAAAEGPGLGRREDVALRLGDELQKSFAAIGASTSAVSQICICGGLPELRTMTVQLTDRLDVEVEPLDSLFGIDPVRMPERADEFRDRCAELRVAWAAAADWPAPIDLLRVRRRQAARTVLSRAAIVAGIAAGVGIGWGIARSQWWRSTDPRPQTRTAENVRPPALGPIPPLRSAPENPATKPTSPATVPMMPATPAPVSAAPATPPTAAVPASSEKATTPPVTRPSSLAPSSAPSTPAQARTLPPPTREPERPPAARTDTRPPLPRAALPVLPPRTAQRTTRPTPATPPAAAPLTPPTRTAPALPPLAVPTPVPVAPVVPLSSAAPPLRPAPPGISGSSPRLSPREPPPRQDAPAPQARRPEPGRTPEVAIPFEATLGTILYSPDRKLAIIDGHIVGVGDEIRGARVTDITSSAVLLRDVQGRLRRLTLRAASR